MEQAQTGPLSDSVRAEAAAWVARLHSGDRSRALEAGLRKWLRAPDHSRAFELATEAWEACGSTRDAVVHLRAVRFQESPQRAMSRYFGMAAAVLVIVLCAVLYRQEPAPTVSTAVGEQSMLTLDDGSRIFLNTDTRLFVQETAAQRRVQLESGEAWFEVAKDVRRPFVVTAGDQVVVALGTAFVVRRDMRQLAVTLVEGRVAVSPLSPASGPERMLAPGQRLTFLGREAPRVDEPAIDSVTAWRRGEVILDKTRLRDAVTEMNRYSAIKLFIDDPSVAHIPVSGIFRAGDSARFAQAVGETYRLAIAHEPHAIRISGPVTR
jgi:transmembrane sensor